MSYKVKHLDGTNREDTYLLYEKPFMEDNLLEQSNYDCILRDLKDNFGELEDKENGWFEDLNREILIIQYANDELLEFADNILDSLHNYPVYNDDDYSEKEFDEFSKNTLYELNYCLSANSDEMDFSNEVKHNKGKYFNELEEATDLLHGLVLNWLMDNTEDMHNGEYYPEEESILKALKSLDVYMSINVLMRKAEESTDFRGHYLSSWEKIPTDYYRRKTETELFNTNDLIENKDLYQENDIKFKFADAHCLNCSKEVRVIIKPMANETDISCEEVALDCL